MSVFFVPCSTVAIPGQVIMISLLSSTLSLGATDRYLQHPMLDLYHLDYIVPFEFTTFIFGGYDSMCIYFFLGGGPNNLRFSFVFLRPKVFFGFFKLGYAGWMKQSGQIMATSHELGPQKVAEEGKSPGNLGW